MIEEKLNKALEGKKVGILIENEKGIIFSINENEKFKSASVIKLFILSYFTDVYGRFDEKVQIPKSTKVSGSIITELKIQECTIYELLLLMTASSCNTSTNVLIDLAGFDQLEKYITECGATNTSLKRHMMDFKAAKNGFDNIASPRDIIKVLKKIENNTTAKKILGMQKNVDRLIRYIYSSDYKFYGKSGELAGVFNDCGIIESPKGRSYCCVMTEGLAKNNAAIICGLSGLSAIGTDNFVYS
ncbi:MAG: class A beta-lactamase-related serine hydrolase [Eubacteriales bacterium]|nr:class A beta-lactamase-related serine hydrolase [Eubacteriales bacterium]